MKWVREIPWPMLLAAAVFLALAPFTPEPHLMEKLRMLAAGSLHRPIDILDLFWHSWPLLLIVLRLLFPAREQRAG